jgi:GTP-binding protein Era
LRDL